MRTGRSILRAARVGAGFLRRAQPTRDIPEDFPADKKALKGLAQSLWQLSIALGHTMSAYSRLSKTRAISVSPDGLLGGKGYVLPLSEIREKLAAIIGSLSAITDALHDEVRAEHWQDMPKDVEEVVEEVEEVREDPEAEAEEEYEEEFGEAPNEGDETESSGEEAGEG